MRLRIERDGRLIEVEVAADLGSVTLEGRTYPVTIVARSGLRTELEIAGERAVVENWPEHFPTPPGPVDVNGERGPVRVERPAGSTPPSAVVARPASSAEVPAVAGPSGVGQPIVPPMPGKVIEVRVHEGEVVRAGQVLLVLEAMKMRNEVTSPVPGVVRGLRASAGANARAREPLLFVEPA
jgi:glutaconyl-CoA/methylmalonyl-CoA decarboxylase subunit gamma